MSDLEFGQPAYLWLLIAPLALALLWVRLFFRRRRDIRQMREQRALPVIERHAAGRGLWFWLALVGASACVIVALARPQALVSVTESASVDFVVLLDGSTSMRVTDVAPDRWQRSVSWLRTFSEVLGWRRERVALALFAHRAAPQVRLTSDPNALFFFLDHLSDEPPFRLRDDTSWDTNIEDGLDWGVKMIDRDEELYGRRLGSRAFVVLSDGQSWTGEVERAIRVAQERNIRIYVVGVGTDAGGFIPQLPPGRYAEPEPPIHSVLDRQSLRAIAQAGGATAPTSSWAPRRTTSSPSGSSATPNARRAARWSGARRSATSTGRSCWPPPSSSAWGCCWSPTGFSSGGNSPPPPSC